MKRVNIDDTNDLPINVVSSVISYLASSTNFHWLPSSTDNLSTTMGGTVYCKNTITPEVLSLAPPLMDFEDELIWFENRGNSNEIVSYDNSNCINACSKYLLNLAFCQPLTPQEQKILLEDVVKHTNFIYQIGLTPSKVLCFTLLYN